MTSTLAIALVSLSLSVISTGIAIASYWRARSNQTYDYAARLQLENESIQGGSGPEAFHYSADLVNVGIKPVEIRNIFIDYGGQSEGTYYKFNVEGLFHLPPNGKRSVGFSISREDYEDVLTKFGVQQCLFRLRVCFANATGGNVEATRNLMGLGPSETTFYAQRGDAIV
ncbi:MULTISPECIES: hypothetical protein [Xanthomonas]|uniref:hypothetical protein n=1 Tax=Xanthomonas TaxID=338 RepID=UPI000B176188|nr:MULTISPECIES: hypothetical protein [Xanthomonas]CAD7713007.1 hypothetical protein LMG31884_03870 [Xanthomonas hydrangeae]CAD7713008.1 hypothetical protein LMG31884_03870 [Xanthomonas hydrangeae]CAD7718593.1 hypothetical protein LMG31887_03880 [Xanthomonas hydrangeae]CAD7718595.1 hypothetical protein LMG31887_03880 [Xanthomonas hydrangeae]